MENVNLKFDTILEKLNEYSDGDTRFIPVKIWLMHLGNNLNGSCFIKEVVEKAIPSLYNTPILAYFEEDREGNVDTSDHRVVIEVKNNEIRTAYKGSAVGVIPSDCNAHFEMRKCDDGVEREFLVVNGLIWRKWNEVDEVFSRDLIKAQSMELDKNCTYHFNDEGYCQFDNFSFFGACVLGNGVRPAMVNSTIEVQFSVNTVMEEIQTKLEQYHNIFSQTSNEVDIDKSKEGGIFTLTNELRDGILSEFGLTLDDVDFEITDDMGENEFRAKLEEFKCGKDDKKKYEADENAKINVEPTENAEQKVEDETPVEPVVESKTLVEDKPEEPVQKESTVDYCAEYEKLKTDYTALETEVVALREFKANIERVERENEENKIFAKFDDKLSEVDDYKTLKANANNYEINALTKECYALYGMYIATAENNNAISEVLTYSVKEPKDTKTSPYGDLFAKYNTKK